MVMLRADQHQVVGIGHAVMSGPVPDVMRLAVIRRHRTLREHTSAVAGPEDIPVVVVRRADRAALGQRHQIREQHPRDRGVAQQALHRLEPDRGAVIEAQHRPVMANPGLQRQRIDMHDHMR
jgi:hypothetical protein